MIPPQIFEPKDLLVIGMLVVLEALLSADNALVLSILVRHLPPDQRKKALTYGLVGAFVFRLVAVIFATWLLKLWWLQFIGAAYLLWLPVKHFMTPQNEKGEEIGKKAGFWGTVAAVELADIAFAIDSILAGVAAVSGDMRKLWVVWIGGFVGVVFLRLAAGYLSALLEKYPRLDALAYVIIGWVGVKMLNMSVKTYYKDTLADWAGGLPLLNPNGFWIGMAIIMVGGTYWALKDHRKTANATPTDAPPSE